MACAMITIYRMPRKRAAERHTDSAPPGNLPDQPAGAALIDALLALHHPMRRRIFEILTNDGPATVGQLAARLDIAVGSVSHHLKPMHRTGFVEPAPELARDTRESWWRGNTRRLSWNAEDYADGIADYFTGTSARTTCQCFSIACGASSSVTVGFGSCIRA